MSDLRLSEEEKRELIGKVTELTERGVLDRRDMLVIMKVCSGACKRWMAEIDEALRPSGTIQ